MPIDPDISLDVAPRPGQASAANPLAAASGLLDTATKFQQLRQFNLQLQARQRAGEIISAAPDVQTGISQLFQDPLVSAYGGQTLRDYMNVQSGLTSQQGAVQAQATSGLSQLLHGLNGAVENPEGFNPILQTFLSTVSPQARPAVEKAANSLRDYLATSKSPEQYRQRLGATLMGSGLPPDTLRATTGVPPAALTTGPYGTGGATTTIPVGGPAYGGGASQEGPPGTPQEGPGPAAAAGASAPIGPSMASQQFLTERSRGITNQLNSLDQRVQLGSTLLPALSEARADLAQIKTGGGATAYMKLGQLAQAFGAPQDLVDKLANGNLGASQELTKLMVNTTAAQMRAQLPVGSHAFQEFDLFNKSNPNLDTDPRAIDKMFGFLTRLYNRDVQEQQTFNEYRKQPGFDVLGWPAYWTQHQLKSGMVQPSTGLAGSQTSVPGLTPQFRWVPGKGLEPIAPAGGGQ